MKFLQCNDTEVEHSDEHSDCKYICSESFQEQLAFKLHEMGKTATRRFAFVNVLEDTASKVTLTYSKKVPECTSNSLHCPIQRALPEAWVLP